MSIDNIKNKLKQTSKKDTTWLKQAKWRKENEKWLDFSFDVAVKIMSTLKSNKKLDISPINQKEFAELMDRSPQYVNKLLRGTENLQIKTIKDIERVLGIKLIEIPSEEPIAIIQKILEFEESIGKFEFNSFNIMTNYFFTDSHFNDFSNSLNPLSKELKSNYEKYLTKDSYDEDVSKNEEILKLAS